MIIFQPMHQAPCMHNSLSRARGILAPLSSEDRALASVVAPPPIPPSVRLPQKPKPHSASPSKKNAHTPASVNHDPTHKGSKSLRSSQSSSDAPHSPMKTDEASDSTQLDIAQKEVLITPAPQRPHGICQKESPNSVAAIVDLQSLEDSNTAIPKPSCTKSRRSIFGQYWNKEQARELLCTRRSARPTTAKPAFHTAPLESIEVVTTVNTSSPPVNVENPVNAKRQCVKPRSVTPPPATVSSNSRRRIYRRSTPISASETSVAAIISPRRDFSMFPPPKTHVSKLCKRFVSIDNAPQMLGPSVTASLMSLPPLPAPLERLCSDGTSTRSLGGMYPLNTTTSILRQRVSSVDASAEGSIADSQSISSKLSSISSRSPSLSSSQRVRIDPRVTVSEFDDPIERHWYSESELDHMKRKTFALAQTYFMAHRKVAEEYNTARMDPVTKTPRKRALFSLPVLSAISFNTEDDDSLQSERMASSFSERTFQNLVENQVQSILIVDPNKAILALLTKSVRQIFPRAYVTSFQCGDEALSMVSAELRKVRGFGSSSEPKRRNFDIIIAEESLLVSSPSDSSVNEASSTPLKSLTSIFSGAPFGKLFTSESYSTYARDPRSLKDAKKAASCSVIESLRSPPPGRRMRGSDFMKTVLKMEAKVFGDTDVPKNKPLFREASSASTSCRCRALLVSIAARPDHKTMREAGADLVWSKLQMPSFGAMLRDQLLGMLVKKRRG